MFPSPTLPLDTRGGLERRFRLYEDAAQRALKKAVALAGACEPLSVHTPCRPFATLTSKVTTVTILQRTT